MKVEIVGEIARLNDGLPPGRSKAFEKVSESQVLADFRAALNGRDSFLHLQGSIVGFPGRSGKSHGACVGQFAIVFRRLDLNSNRSLYSILSQTLQGLLKARSSSDALFVKLCVTPPPTEDARAQDLCLVLQLEAIGSTPEQAEMRWGYGLVHVQEALIHASRLLRQHVAKPVA
jgi:hypothetical protein